MKLISMTDFVLNLQMSNETIMNRYAKIVSYAQFLKQPLTLEMFIACDDDENVLEIPKFFYTEENIKKLKGVEIEIALLKNKEVENYKTAKSKVLFNGFEYDNGYLKKENICLNFKLFKTIEDLVVYNLDLAVSF